MFIHECNKYGLARVKVRPLKYLKRSIYALKVVQVGQCFSLVLAITGCSKTNIVTEFLNLWMRCVFCFISIENFDESSGPFIFIAFAAFAIAEPVRYPFYLLKILDLENTVIGRFFSHLRYNLFIVFYPLGALCDLLTGIYSAANMEKSG
jgi:hypothetical protein